MSWIVTLFRRLLLDQWRHIDRECAEDAAREAKERQERQARSRGGVAAASEQRAASTRARSARRGKRRGEAESAGIPVREASQAARSSWYDWRVLVVLVVASISLSLQEYYGERGFFRQLVPLDRDDPQPYWDLMGFAWWSGWRFFGYVVIPVATIWLMPGERVRDYYVSFRDFARHLRIYLVLFALVLPMVIVASQTEVFYRTYPFYKWSNRSLFDLLAWEGLYALQFLSLEFFFRGFLLRGLGRAMGSKAIFVMIVPYCMIHFGKPFPETLGAIFAGIILGTLAMRTRSIWGGVLIHVGVAFTMDFLALGHCPPRDSGLPCQGH